MDPFKGSDIPILVLTNQVDEITFSQLTDYKGHLFANIENSYDEISRELGEYLNKDIKS